MWFVGIVVVALTRVECPRCCECHAVAVLRECHTVARGPVLVMVLVVLSCSTVPRSADGSHGQGIILVYDRCRCVLPYR